MSFCLIFDVNTVRQASFVRKDNFNGMRGEREMSNDNEKRRSYIPLTLGIISFCRILLQNH